MKEVLRVWCIDGYSDEGSWELELFSTYEKAKKAFDDYVSEYEDYYDTKCNVNNDYASYMCDNHYGDFWINEIPVR